ncbi:hypothetical protein [Effusibacillus lacus]|uniref:Uncharacterized protein n=1 Tax=Effusibacillus lacus TaxID=1348429 RepID=A0A292YHN8_9BACL|nr:hypothetical protein [Effusibacillus lacus]TCS72794.1 hypothetical protein EDD64_1209 [Effusibacillus lacus]GAX89278.1 hypothetical protein EFBL_0896 [Effusibacillus lacus]
MKLIAKAEQNYPFSEHIIHVENSAGKNYELVTWHFPNGQMVQLVMYSPEDAELYSMPPSLVLADEGDQGQFYTAKEIELFLSRIMNS